MESYWLMEQTFPIPLYHWIARLWKEPIVRSASCTVPASIGAALKTPLYLSSVSCR